ncbi:type III-B CRISPR module-associated protein Cmr5 [Nocardiopsis kunsanensis]|uniref:CRISPR type III-B/RAMP module-associated protein Cmr5 n=1 Tax=Nocardiopsis kunsanensis TaxID=141693 RepID=A0A918X844_9ACTN|nr:type III-B CRISPR module-associated protein Cmr5 [Nocardiopsis kunsanensis]GHD16453.1 hypothetical protein GCM10007147_04570 [Nocardiopsis kunsanensis]
MTEFKRVGQHMAVKAAHIIDRSESAHSKELRARFRQLPGQLRISGLTATYAFLASRESSPSAEGLQKAYKEVTEQIREHLVEKSPIGDGAIGTDLPKAHHETLTALGKMGPLDYARATREISELFVWLRRLSDTVSPRGPERSEDNR